MPKLVELQFSKTAASLRRLVIFCLPVSGSLRTTNYGSLGQRDSWYICMYVYICILTKATDGMLWKKNRYPVGERPCTIRCDHTLMHQATPSNLNAMLPYKMHNSNVFTRTKPPLTYRVPFIFTHNTDFNTQNNHALYTQNDALCTYRRRIPTQKRRNIHKHTGMHFTFTQSVA